ncbi:excinuclease ABC subunit UvrA [Thiotrichales bacterium 19S3-7]|nr:excinuclease ABC subunit UvrA [Thiotrichales bacterium 19S3-7]MCF6800822.1 excinuclease ABC subunit UvrA [Thiotrichales bacterium 19S3-11]
MDTITIKGARTHNLKNIDLEIPRDKLIVITGLSGSGKSSLAFDTLYAEGQRRYVESLSAYARQFLSLMEKPDVDHIEGLSPAISIEQKTTSHNPRSTVGTVTEIYDYLRVLYARLGEPKCPTHHSTLKAQTISEMVDQTLNFDDDRKFMVLATVIQHRKGEHKDLFKKLQAEGYLRVRIDGEVHTLDDLPVIDKNKNHTIDVVVDRLKVKITQRQRLTESFETALDLANGLACVSFLDGDHETLLFSSKHACPNCNYSLKELSPRLFSFNNPIGACPQCDGIGHKSYFDPEKIIYNGQKSLSEGAIKGWDRQHNYYFQQLNALAEYYQFSIDVPFNELPHDIKEIILYGSGNTLIEMTLDSHFSGRQTRSKRFEGVIPHLERRFKETDSGLIRDELDKLRSNLRCPSCNGARLNEAARYVFFKDKPLFELTELSIESAFDWLDSLTFKGQQQIIAQRLLKEIKLRLKFLINVGLNYLNLSRRADTLSGGEAQRIRLASQIGAGLVGVMYVLDEPSIGLHQRDNQRLIDTLIHLRDLGNTVIVVEHDEDAIRHGDFIIDIGPGAGVHGGEIITYGTPDEIIQSQHSLTADYLSGRKKIALPKKRLAIDKKRMLTITGASGNNLKSVTLNLPLGVLTCITGVSGSGKSTLINQTLYPLAAKLLNNATTLSPQPYTNIAGIEHLDKVIDIDQSPIGRTPRSNPATYTGLFSPIRELFAKTQEARARGYKAGRFSFNVKGGRCEACQGDGVIKVEMHFLADIYVTCDICQGKRYNRETLEILYKGKNISDVLEMTVEDALDFFDAIPQIKRKLETLMEVGLSYIHLGQNATTLSGGEAQRVKLAKELSRRSTGKTLYILDEPTTGLHFHDIQQLLKVIHTLRDQGNTLVIIEHNLDVIKTADWIIDLGPEGGSGGGEIIAQGKPEAIVKVKQSHTGVFLKPFLNLKSKQISTENE